MNLNSEIKEMIARCETCRKFAASQPGTLILVETPSKSWEKIEVDLFSFNNKHFPIKQLKTTDQVRSLHPVYVCIHLVWRFGTFPQRSWRPSDDPPFRHTHLTLGDVMLSLGAIALTLVTKLTQRPHTTNILLCNIACERQTILPAHRR